MSLMRGIIDAKKRGSHDDDVVALLTKDGLSLWYLVPWADVNYVVFSCSYLRLILLYDNYGSYNKRNDKQKMSYVLLCTKLVYCTS